MKLKNKKMLSIVMSTFVGLSSLGCLGIKNSVLANPVIDGKYVLPSNYRASEEEISILKKMVNKEISSQNINKFMYIYNGQNIEECEEGLGYTPLMIAAEKGWLLLANTLLNLRVNLKYTDGTTVKGIMAIDPNASDTLGVSQGRAALHLAAQNNHVEIIEMLLMAGANINAEDSKGDKPRTLSANNHSLQALECLIRYGAQ